MDNLYMYREIKLKDIEIFLINKHRFGKLIGYLAFIDFNRPSNLDDFPYLKHLEDPNDFGRSNFLKSLFISNETITPEIKEYLNDFSDSMIGNKHDCDWNIEFLLLENPLSELNNLDILNVYTNILSNSYGLNLKIEPITMEKLNHLSQD